MRQHSTHRACISSTHVGTNVRKHLETHPMHSATPGLEHENVDSRYLSCNSDPCKGALLALLLHTSSHGSEPAPACNRAVGACCHTQLHGVAEAENCNCNCMSKACGVTDRDQRPSDVAHVTHGSFASCDYHCRCVILFDDIVRSLVVSRDGLYTSFVSECCTSLRIGAKYMVSTRKTEHNL